MPARSIASANGPASMVFFGGSFAFAAGIGGTSTLVVGLILSFFAVRSRLALASVSLLFVSGFPLFDFIFNPTAPPAFWVFGADRAGLLPLPACLRAFEI